LAESEHIKVSNCRILKVFGVLNSLLIAHNLFYVLSAYNSINNYNTDC